MRLKEQVRIAPMRTALGALAVGVAISYGGDKPASHVVRFDKNGENVEGVMTNQVFVAGAGTAPAPLLPCAFTRAGCTFAGWSTQPTYGTIYADEAPLCFERSGETTFYAAWVSNGCYAVCFDPGEAHAGFVTNMIPYLHVKAETVAVLPRPEEGFARHDEYRLTGWVSASGRRYDPGILVFNLTNKVNAVISLEAVWE